MDHGFGRILSEERFYHLTVWTVVIAPKAISTMGASAMTGISGDWIEQSALMNGQD